MILLSINTIVNLLILMTLLLYPYIFSFWPDNLVSFVIVCFLIQVLLLILGMSRKGYWVLRLYQSYRKLIQREIDYIKPLAEEVMNQHNIVYKTKYKYQDFNFYISDVQEPNVYAFSKHCIVMSAGFLKFASEDEFKAVLAHELGHLYYRDTQILMGAFWTELPSRIYYIAYRVLIKTTTALCQQKPLMLLCMGLFGFFLVLYFLPAYLLSFINNRVFYLILKLNSKRTEYRADYHAYKVGYGEGLASFLEKLSHTIAHDSRFFADLVASHPAPMLRVGRLESYLKNGDSNVRYDKVSHIDKLFPTLVLVSIMGGAMIYGDYLTEKYRDERRAKYNALKATTKPHNYKYHPKPQGEAWVYIYNTTWNNKHSDYIVYYKLRNKGPMQQIEVRHMPNTYKMKLTELEKLL